MNTTTEATPAAVHPLGELGAALAKAQGAMEPALRDSRNPQLGTSYADFASIWRACRKPLADNQLAVVQAFLPGAGGCVELVTTLIHSSGQTISSRLPIPGTEAAEGGLPLQPSKTVGHVTLGTAIAYARRYALAALVGVVVDDVPEAPAQRRQQQQERPAQQPKQEPPAQPAASAEAVTLWRASVQAAADYDALDRVLGELRKAFPHPPKGQPDHAIIAAVAGDVKAKRTQLAAAVAS